MPATVKITETKAIDQELARVAAFLRGAIAKKAVRAGANVVKKRLKEIIPRSIETGTRKGWSKKMRDSRSGVKPHVETIGVVVRDYGLHFVAVVGAQYPAGALSHLIEKDHKLVAWGKPAGMVVTGHAYTEQAADQTIAQQQQAIESTVTSEVAKQLAR